MPHRGHGRLHRQGPRCNQLGQGTTAGGAERRLRDAVPDLAAVNTRGYSDALILTEVLALGFGGTSNPRHGRLTN